MLNIFRESQCCTLHSLLFINPRPEGYGIRFVILSIYLSTALQRVALTSSRQLRYEQAKHVDGLQSDRWILLKCFRSSYGWLTVIAFLDFSEDKNTHSWLPRHL